MRVQLVEQSPGGVRLDHAFISTPMQARLRSASYPTHTPTFRLVTPGVRPVVAEAPAPLSDHAALIIGLAAD